LAHKAKAPPFAPRLTTPHPQHRKINCTLQNAVVEKAAWWAAMCHVGYSTHSNFASAALQNQLHSANCTRRKVCGDGLRCDTRGWRLKPQLHHLLRIRSAAKSIAPCGMHVQKKLHGGLRGDMRKVRLRCKACRAEERAAFRSTPTTPLPHLRKINCTLATAPAEKSPKKIAVQRPTAYATA